MTQMLIWWRGLEICGLIYLWLPSEKGFPMFLEAKGTGHESSRGLALLQLDLPGEHLRLGTVVDAHLSAKGRLAAER